MATTKLTTEQLDALKSQLGPLLVTRELFVQNAATQSEFRTLLQSIIDLVNQIKEGS